MNAQNAVARLKQSVLNITSLAQVLFALSVALVLLLFLVMILTRAGALSIETGFEYLTLKVAPRIAMVLAGLSLLSLLISVFKAPLKYAPWALAACVINLGLIAGYYAYVQALYRAPPVADVSTNWEEPVTFSDRMVTTRGATARPIRDVTRITSAESVEWSGQTVAEINAKTCPGARPVTSVKMDEDRVARILRNTDIQVFGSSPWRVEGTYRNDLYGFSYDVAVRIEPERIDVRAISRQNFPDLGATCRIVTRIVEAIEKG